MSQDDFSVHRKIYFFRIEHFIELKDSLQNALDRISDLKFDDEGRYRFDPSSNTRLSAYPDTKEYPLKLRFGRIKRDTLPQVESGGNLQTLQLQEDEGLIDISHIVIFADGFVAAEWNPDAPKLAALGPYLFEKGRINTNVNFNYLVERDIVDVLKNLESATALTIEMPPDSIALARHADQNLAAALEATAALGASKYTEFTLTASSASLKLRDLALRIAETIKSFSSEKGSIKTLDLKGYDKGSKKLRYIDVLESKLISSADFPKYNKRSRSVNSHEAYIRLEQLFEENRDRIHHSAIISDMP